MFARYATADSTLCEFAEFMTSLVQLRLSLSLLPSSRSSFLLLCFQEINPFHRQAGEVNLRCPYERICSLPVVVARGSGVSGLR